MHAVDVTFKEIILIALVFVFLTFDNSLFALQSVEIFHITIRL